LVPVALSAALLAACLAYAALRALRSSRIASLLLDRATSRSMHSGAVPRIGGIGIAIAVALTLAVVGPAQWPDGMRALAGAVVAMLALSALDDARPLPAGLRLLAHLAAAALLAHAWGTPAPWLPVATLAIAWGANLYNFMDGADGLAGGMTVSGYSVLAIAAHLAGDAALALACATVAGGAFGFLLLNWHPARLFLGDAGSIPLGFAAAAIALFGVLRGHWPATLPLIAFFPFVFDASVTLAARALRGARLAEPHREHLYQRAALAGLGHRRVALAAYALMAVCAIAALACRGFAIPAQLAILAAVCALHTGLWLVAQRMIIASRPR
jgi:UDP-N-acetylmuramyl pentapeptide phosphotransferase/UDP-N-acetylglucosamine-1-phosphate transferase